MEDAMVSLTGQRDAAIMEKNQFQDDAAKRAQEIDELNELVRDHMSRDEEVSQLQVLLEDFRMKEIQWKKQEIDYQKLHNELQAAKNSIAKMQGTFLLFALVIFIFNI